MTLRTLVLSLGIAASSVAFAQQPPPSQPKQDAPQASDCKIPDFDTYQESLKAQGLEGKELADAINARRQELCGNDGKATPPNPGTGANGTPPQPGTGAATPPTPGEGASPAAPPEGGDAPPPPPPAKGKKKSKK